MASSVADHASRDAEPLVVRAGGLTLAEAVAASRRPGRGVRRRIVVEAGEYLLTTPLMLDSSDSGLEIVAEPDARPVLSGGRELSGWEADGEQFLAASVAGVFEGTTDFRHLVVNGRLAPRARLPREGTFPHETEFAVRWMSTTGGGWERKPTEDELSELRFCEGDIGAWLDPRNAELTVYHMWDESVVGLAGLDLAARRLVFSTPAGHPPGAFGVKKYALWNIRQGMHEPGQWYLDRTRGKVVYWPRPDEDPASLTVVVPTIHSLIEIRGMSDAPVRDIVIEGLTLTATTTPLVAGGFGANRFSGAIDVEHAERCRLAGLDIVNVGGQGIKATGAGIEITRCHVRETGACGIICRGPAHTVTDNHVHHVGQTYPSAIGLWVNAGKTSDGGQVTHNTVHDTPYSGIAAGGHDLLIADNHLWHTMLELHDGAAIYFTFGERLVLRGNFVHDVPDTGGYGSSAYYLDEQAADCTVEGNLSLRVARPMHNHMAHHNVVRRNVFVIEGDASISLAKCHDYTFEHNVIVASGELLIRDPAAIVRALGNHVTRLAEPLPAALRDGFTVGAPKLEVDDAGRVVVVSEIPGIPSRLDVSASGVT